MIYTVECAFSEPSREDEWNAYYSGQKLENLLSLDGFRATQRFRATMQMTAPYLAVHSVRDELVLEQRSYASIGGGTFDGWDNFITNWKRNLFSGIGVAPEVTSNECLIVLDDPKEGEIPSLDFAWLKIVGLDHSAERRGFAVVDRATGEQFAANADPVLRVFRPITDRFLSAAENDS